MATPLTSGAALDALGAAAANAAKAGGGSSEFKATVISVIVSTLIAGVHLFATVPGPWSGVAALAVAAMNGAAAAYSVSRGNVKKAALAGAAAVVVAAQHRTAQPPPVPEDAKEPAV